MLTLEERWAIGDRAPLPKVANSLQSGCAVCGEEKNIRTCSACYVVSYCGPDHQRAHRRTHRFVCDAVKNEKLALQSAEAHAQANTTNTRGFHSGANLLPLMQLPDPAMLQLFQAYHQSSLTVFLRRINTVKSVQAQKGHFQRCNALLFANSLDFHCAALEATARLGQDQELYDSIKALCIFQMIDGTFHHENVLESIDFMIQPTDSFWYHRILDLLVLMTFFKVKLLLDLMRLDVARTALGSKFPREVLDMVLLNIPESRTVTTNRGIMNSTDLIAEITTIAAQVDLLLAEVNDRNPRFWNKLALHNPNNSLVERPTQQELSNHSLAQAKDLFLCHVYCWFETPGAIALLRRKRGF